MAIFVTELKSRLAIVLINLLEEIVEKFPALSLSDVVFIMLINVKMPTIVGILMFMSRIFVLS